MQGAPGPLETVAGTSGLAPQEGCGNEVRGELWATGLKEEPPAQLISQESSPGVRYEYHLPLSTPRPGFSWSHGSWSDCSAECGGGEAAARGTGCSFLSSHSSPVGEGDKCLRHLQVLGSPWGNPGGGGLHKGPLPQLGEPDLSHWRRFHGQ